MTIFGRVDGRGGSILQAGAAYVALPFFKKWGRKSKFWSKWLRKNIIYGGGGKEGENR